MISRGIAKTFLFFNNKEDSRLVLEVIDKVYDDFESRVCENCDSLSDGLCSTYRCNNECVPIGGMSEVTVKSFGCNSFKKH